MGIRFAWPSYTVMTVRRVVLLVSLSTAVAACGQERIEVRRGESADYNQTAMLRAVDKFVAAGRTPEAYGELSQTALQLRAGMDHAVAHETELKLMVLALGPVQSVHAKPMSNQVDALALTVWPTLLAPEFESDEVMVKHDPKTAQMLPLSGETPQTYLIRLCGGALSADCKHVVPEMQGPIIAAVATRRATERVRNAVGDCVMCGADPGWHEAVRAWEALDRMANATINESERHSDPDNWPVAGGAAELDAGLPEAEVNQAGEVVIGGQHYAGNQRVPALRDLRGDSHALALHLRPDLSLAQVRALLIDVHKSGASQVAVIARSAYYPWQRKMYWIADGVGTETGLRPTDSLQLLLHAVDAIAGPGTIARVD
jgi:hypothetical protein